MRAPHLRVLDRVDQKSTPGCWIFTGCRIRGGYGMVRTGSVLDGSARSKLAHRVVYEAIVGPIPEGLELDHLCRNPACVNPAHLEPVDHRTNVLRGFSPSAIHARKTHCVNGHEFTTENTLVDKKGKRNCRACARAARRRRDERDRLASAGVAL
jgi:hypothetical protein